MVKLLRLSHIMYCINDKNYDRKMKYHVSKAQSMGKLVPIGY